MPGDEHDAVARKLAGQCHRLIGITGVVAHDQLDRLPEDATLGVESRHRQLGAALILLPNQALAPVISPATAIRISASAAGAQSAEAAITLTTSSPVPTIAGPRSCGRIVRSCGTGGNVAGLGLSTASDGYERRHQEADAGQGGAEGAAGRDPA
jgi:hypothetical protein